MIPNAMPPFDFGLGETADALRDQVQRFAADQVAPIAAELDKTDRFPRELWPKMGALGLHGIGSSSIQYLRTKRPMVETLKSSFILPPSHRLFCSYTYCCMNSEYECIVRTL